MTRAPAWFVLIALIAALATACTPSIPEGRFACSLDEDCPPQQRCDTTRRRCHLPDGG